MKKSAKIGIGVGAAAFVGAAVLGVKYFFDHMFDGLNFEQDLIEPAEEPRSVDKKEECQQKCEAVIEKAEDIAKKVEQRVEDTVREIRKSMEH